MHDLINGILKRSPEVKLFLIGCEQIAGEAIRKASSHLPRPQRQKFRSRREADWRVQVDQLLDDARTAPLEEVRRHVERIPFGGITCTDDRLEAHRVIRDYSRSAHANRRGVGIHDEQLSPQLVSIWLWRD